MRLGEICALKRKHVFYEEGLLRIHATMQRVQAAEAEKGPKTKIVITEPKSFHSIREIPIPSFLLEHMEYMRSYPEEAYLLTSGNPAFSGKKRAFQDTAPGNPPGGSLWRDIRSLSPDRFCRGIS